MTETGLVLVDIQNDYFPGGRMQLVGIEQVGIKAEMLLSYFRGKHLPTFHIQHTSVRKDATFFLPGTAGIEFHDSIKPLDDEVVIQKHYPNSFRETTLLQELNKRNIGHVVVCGAMSHMCIDATTRAAFDHGFECTVIQDACATRDLEFEGQTISAKQVHGSFMAALGYAYAQVKRLDDFI